jgi:hypothetical protein
MQATLIKVQISGSGAIQKIYRVDPPICGYNDYNEEGERQEAPTYDVVCVSSGFVVGQLETYIFPSDEDGEITSFLELPGSRKGGVSHEYVLEGLGYEVVE